MWVWLLRSFTFVKALESTIQHLATSVEGWRKYSAELELKLKEFEMTVKVEADSGNGELH